MSFRVVRRVLGDTRVVDRDGRVLVRPLPVEGAAHLDPVLCVQQAGPEGLVPGRALLPRQPLEGLESLLLVQKGRVRWQDSLGNDLALGPGDALLATAGSGLVREVCSVEERGEPTHELVEVWINLPRASKAAAPAVTLLPRTDQPQLSEDAGRVKTQLVVGSLGNTRASSARTVAGTSVALVTLWPGARLQQPVRAGWTACVYVTDGVVRLGSGRVARHGQLIWFERAGDLLLLENPINTQAPLEGVVIAGPELTESIALSEGISLNTSDELARARERWSSPAAPRLPAWRAPAP
jgi:redox-sensitive bicupin YhaK (pirin superfamily)